MKETEVLSKWMRENSLNAPKLAKMLGVSVQTIYDRINQEDGKVPGSFKYKLQDKGLDVFGFKAELNLSDLLEAKEQVIKEKEQRLKEKDDMIVLLQKLLADKDKQVEELQSEKRRLESIERKIEGFGKSTAVKMDQGVKQLVEMFKSIKTTA